MAEPRSDGRDLDLVLFGATGFTGALTAAHLAAHAPPDVRIGLAGRSEERLRAVRAGLGPAAADWPLLVADSGDPASLEALAVTTRVVATTVGPYARHGLPLVDACARSGTHYADLTGEVLFVRDSIDRFDKVARDSGARIVHSCGFDSVPFDLGVLLAADAARTDGAGDIDDTTIVVTALRGGMSGGTIDSLRNQLAVVRAHPELAAVIEDPYSLSPDRATEPDLGRQPDLIRPHNDPELGGWIGPFVMAPYNSRIIRRSNALQDQAYGERFRYREVMRFGTSPVAPVIAYGMTGGLWAFSAAMSAGPTRSLLDRVLPKPGEGPSEQRRTKGYFRLEVHARSSSGSRYLVHVGAPIDPGYGGTAIMLGESALALALDAGHLPDAAGVLTPATGIGAHLAERLRANRFRFDVAAPGTGSAAQPPK